MLSFQRRPNAEAITLLFLSELNINTEFQQVQEELEKHPEYPSLLSINEVLNWFGVETGAYNIGTEDLTEVPTPFIAHTNRNKDFLLVKKIADDVVIVSDHKRKNYQMKLADLKEIFAGVVLVNESKLDAAKPNLLTGANLSLFKSLTPLLGFLILLIGGGLFYTDFLTNLNWLTGIIFLVKTTGLIVSILLLIQSLDKNNPLIQTLCGGAKTDCNAILSSKAAEVFKGLSWSEVGFFYFAGTWLAVFYGSGNPQILKLLALLNICGLPYTIYSINYQARIVKKWCTLCTTVQVLLWVEFLSFSFMLKDKFSFDHAYFFKNVGSLIFFMTIPVVLWMILKPLLIGGQQAQTLKYQVRRFKYNRSAFENLLKEQPKFAAPEDDWSIVLGNEVAETVITMVSNPYCSPCSDTHSELEAWLEKLDNIQLRIIFTANNDESDSKTPVVRHFMALRNLNDKKLIKSALTDWYAQKRKNYEEWAAKYPVAINKDKFYQLNMQNNWCRLADVAVTPTLLINGYRLPPVYRLRDVKYMF